MMPPMHDASEKAFQDAVIKAANMLDWDAHHVRPGLYGGSFYMTAGLKGMPDLILIGRRGQGLIFAELKTESGKLSTEQRARLHQLKVCGAEVHVWRPSDMQTIIDRLSAWKNDWNPANN